MGEEEGEFKKQMKTTADITNSLCNYACRLDGKKFPKPDMTAEWISLKIVEEAKKEFPCEENAERLGAPQIGYEEWVANEADKFYKKWFGEKK